ncbi:MAG TPA: hypothetical protein ENI52_02270 [Thermoplasmata archaeon]|nr:hypothetical protein [Thermoplasmata archaeon]
MKTVSVSMALMFTLLFITSFADNSSNIDIRGKKLSVFVEMEKNSFSLINFEKNTWSKTLGKFLFPDLGNDVEQTRDGGYIIAGMTILPLSLEVGGWLIKLNENGIKEWDRVFRNIDNLIGVEVLSDGYVVAGNGKKGDIEIIKMDEMGNVVWNKSFGGKYLDIIKSCGCIKRTENGCIILVTSWSFSNNKGADLWLIKIDENGNEEWNRTYGKAKEADIGYQVIESNDEGYIIVGQSFNLSAPEYGLIMKVDENGNEKWSIRTGYSIFSVESAGNSSYIATGSKWIKENIDYALLLLKFNEKGEIKWIKMFGSKDSDDAGYFIIHADGGSYIICGNSDYRGDNNIWLLKIDENGNEKWSKIYGKRGWDMGRCIKQTYDGGYIIVGETTQFPWMFFPYRLNLWIIKTDENGEVSLLKSFLRNQSET